VPAREQAGEGEPDLRLLAYDDFADLRGNRLDAL